MSTVASRGSYHAPKSTLERLVIDGGSRCGAKCRRATRERRIKSVEFRVCSMKTSRYFTMSDRLDVDDLEKTPVMTLEKEVLERRALESGPKLGWDSGGVESLATVLTRALRPLGIQEDVLIRFFISSHATTVISHL